MSDLIDYRSPNLRFIIMLYLLSSFIGDSIQQLSIILMRRRSKAIQNKPLELQVNQDSSSSVSHLVRLNSLNLSKQHAQLAIKPIIEIKQLLAILSEKQSNIQTPQYLIIPEHRNLYTKAVRGDTIYEVELCQSDRVQAITLSESLQKMKTLDNSLDVNKLELIKVLQFFYKEDIQNFQNIEMLQANSKVSPHQKLCTSGITHNSVLYYITFEGIKPKEDDTESTSVPKNEQVPEMKPLLSFGDNSQAEVVNFKKKQNPYKKMSIELELPGNRQIKMLYKKKPNSNEKKNPQNRLTPPQQVIMPIHSHNQMIQPPKIAIDIEQPLDLCIDSDTESSDDEGSSDWLKKPINLNDKKMESKLCISPTKIDRLLQQDMDLNNEEFQQF